VVAEGGVVAGGRDVVTPRTAAESSSTAARGDCGRGRPSAGTGGRPASLSLDAAPRGSWRADGGLDVRHVDARDAAAVELGLFDHVLEVTALGGATSPVTMNSPLAIACLMPTGKTPIGRPRRGGRRGGGYGAGGVPGQGWERCIRTGGGWAPSGEGGLRARALRGRPALWSRVSQSPCAGPRVACTDHGHGRLLLPPAL